MTKGGIRKNYFTQDNQRLAHTDQSVEVRFTDLVEAALEHDGQTTWEGDTWHRCQ